MGSSATLRKFKFTLKTGANGNLFVKLNPKDIKDSIVSSSEPDAVTVYSIVSTNSHLAELIKDSMISYN